MSTPVYSAGDFTEAAVIPADDHGALFGAGFFETFRTRDGVPVRLPEHLARLHAACAKIGIRIPETHLAAGTSPEKWRPVIARLLGAHGLTDGVFRLTVTAGRSPGAPGTGFYDSPGETLAVRPPPPEPPAGGIGLQLLVTRRDTGEWRPRPKSLNYLNSLLAARELAPLRRHPADEGLMLDAAGRVSEGVFSNVFWSRAGVVFTPHENTGCLPGIGRARLLSGLRTAGVRVEEVETGPEALRDADAVAMVSCVRGVVPVAGIFSPDSKVYWESGDVTSVALRPLQLAFGVPG